MSEPKRFDRIDRVVTREIAGETLLVPIHTDAADMHHIFVLNPVAAHVWKQLDEAVDLERLVASVCAAFEVNQEQARRDVTTFLDELRQADLLRET